DGLDPRGGPRPDVASHVSTGTFLRAALRQPEPARVCDTVNFCMSHAPVGQRSAHRPQCRHTSSSFTITRPVFKPCATYKSCVRLREGALSRARSSVSSPSRVNVMQSMGQMSTQASHSMQRGGLNTVC